MTLARLFAIGFVFFCTAVGWVLLGGSVVHRSDLEGRLADEVAELWGGPQSQVAPAVWLDTWTLPRRAAAGTRQGETAEGEQAELVVSRAPLPLLASRVTVDLDLEHRRRGLLWHDTYTVDFSARYRAQVPEAALPHGGSLVVELPLPSPHGIYDGFVLRVNGVEAEAVSDLSQGARVRLEAVPGAQLDIETAYRSRGLDVWSYRFTPEGVAHVQEFVLTATTDFTDLDFPAGTLSPSRKERAGAGWRLDWSFDRLLTGDGIGIDLPNKLNPGPLAARITFFAPISLLFFLTVFVVLGALRRVDLHPMHYFFLAGAFFAFHLLLAYLVDHLNIHLAFALAATVSLVLVGSYLRRVAGAHGAVGLALLSQGVFLVLFSYAFFFEGYTGLTVTIGAVVTLFLLMQMTARVDWASVLRRGHGAPAATSEPG